MKYVVFKSSGKQYKVAEGDVIELERLALKAGEEFTTSEVLLYVNEATHKVGSPHVDGVRVMGKVVEHARGEKIRVSKYKAKVHYRRTTGHRQELTTVKIERIVDGTEKTTVKQVQSEKPKATTKKAAPRARKKSA